MDRDKIKHKFLEQKYKKAKNFQIWYDNKFSYIDEDDEVHIIENAEEISGEENSGCNCCVLEMPPCHFCTDLGGWCKVHRCVRKYCQCW